MGAGNETTFRGADRRAAVHASATGLASSRYLRAIALVMLALSLVAAASRVLPASVPGDGWPIAAASALVGLATTAAFLSCWAISGHSWPVYLSLALIPAWSLAELASTRFGHDRPTTLLMLGFVAAAVAASVITGGRRQPEVDSALRPIAMMSKLVVALAVEITVASAVPTDWTHRSIVLGGLLTSVLWFTAAALCTTGRRTGATSFVRIALVAFGLAALDRTFGAGTTTESARSWVLASSRAVTLAGWLVLLWVAIQEVQAARVADDHRQRALRSSRDGINRDLLAHERRVDERDHDLRSLVAGIQVATTTLTRYRTHLDAGEQLTLELSLAAEISRLARSIDRVAAAASPTYSLRAAIDPVVLSERLRGTVVVDDLRDAVLVGGADAVASIVQNLLANARRHAPGATVTVRSDVLPTTVRISIEDDGPGMTSAAREQASTVFASGRLPAPRKSDGWHTDHEHGLGLLICARLVDDQGGRVDLVETQRGTRFDIVLPRTGYHESISLNFDHAEQAAS